MSRAPMAKRAACLLVLALALAPTLAGCGDGKGGGESAKSDPDAPKTTAAYAVHTVDKPGKRTGTLTGDDVLVVGEDTLSDSLIKEIEAIKVKGAEAVTETTQLSIGYISVEGQQYDVAAVDLEGFRTFSQARTADFQDQWDRLAGGEFAADDTLKGKLPLNKAGYLAAGSGSEVHLIHEGAYAPQAAGVDVVVNTEWGKALKLPDDNALLISTGGVSPQAMRKPLEKVLGEGYSIQDLDVVAEYGLDTGADQVVQPIGTFGDAVGTFRYRPLGGGRVQPEESWVNSHIVTESVPILGEVTCNRYMMPQLKAALGEVVSSGLTKEIHPDEYAGCYYPRFIAGSTKLSNHSFGLALDMNVPGNQRGTTGEMHRGVVAIFKKWGFAWGGDWGYTDPMHFELSEIVKVK